MTPPIVLQAWRALAGGGITFRGDYATWEQARAASSGYDDASIVERARAAADKVRRGEAAMDRDGVAFAQPDYSYAVIAALLRRARERLTVLDFGGALGGSCRQFLAFGASVPHLDWRVVEQPSMAAAGREGYTSAGLRFFDTIAESLRDGPPDVVLFSSVLQYLPEPYRVIEELGSIPGVALVVDRTPSDDGARDLLSVQTVPPSIYPASYPCWIFSRPRLEAALGARHVLRAAFTDPTTGWRSDRGGFALRGYVCDPKA